MALSFSTLWPLSFLIVAVADDLIFKKFHNWLFLTLTALGLFAAISLLEMPLSQIGYGFLAGGALMLPLVLFGVLGAGDMKFMMCLGLITGSVAITNIFIMALFWGALIGLIKIILSGRFSLLSLNLYNLTQKQKPQSLHKIPYTVAIFLAWLSWHHYGGVL